MLNYRQADDVASLLKPFLHPDGAMSADNYKLHVKTTNKNYKDLIQLIAEIDVSMRQLKISVTMNDELVNSNDQSNKNDNSDEKSETEEYTTAPRTQVKQITVQEGKWASLSTGESIPVGQRIVNPDGTVTESVTYRTINKKYQMLPRITGEKVTLFVRHQSNHQVESDSKTQSETVELTLTGKLNQWILLGGVDRTEVNQPGSRVYSTKRSESQNKKMYVKVEVIQ